MRPSEGPIEPIVIKPETILFISSRSDIAGGEKYLLSVMRHLDRERFNPIVVLPGSGPFETPLARLGVEVAIVEEQRGWLKQSESWYRLLEGLHRRVRRLADIIREKDVALVHTNSNRFLEGAFAARQLGVPHLYLAHIEFDPSLPLFQRLAIQQTTFAQLMGDLSSKIVAVSASVASTLSPPVHPNLIKIIHNGLEPELLHQAVSEDPDGLRSELGLTKGAVIVTALGRVDPDKGYEYLVQAAVRVLAETENVHFVHAGAEDDKGYADRLRSRVKDVGGIGHFHFLGFRRDVPRLLAGSDVFVLPSRREGHPFALLEAMAAGRASVATRCGGVEETLIDGVTGYLVDIANTEAIADRLIDLVKNPKRRAEMGAAARRHVQKSFAARDMVKGLMDVYEEILAMPRPIGNSVGVDLFLRCAHEIGSLGLQVVQFENRLRQTEHFVQSIKRVLPLRLARAGHDAWKKIRRRPLS